MAQLTIQQAFDFALQHHRAGQLQQAEQLYRQILAQQPEHADAIHALGLIAHQVGRNDVAVELIRRAIILNPNVPAAHSNLGKILRDQRQFDEAIAACRRAIALKPDYPEAHVNLGDALQDKGQIDEAIEAYGKSIVLHIGLGNALAQKGQLDEAIAAYRRVVALNPSFAEAHSNLGNALEKKGELDEALASQRQAVELKPHLSEAFVNLGNVLHARGQIDDAIAAYHRAIALRASSAKAHGNLIFAMHHHGGYDGKMIADELRRWNFQHAEPLKKFIRPHTNDRDPNRRLRIGYVSPDFRQHPVGWFLRPLLANHDKSRFEIYAYAQTPSPDAMTQELQSHIDVWRNIVGLSGAGAADLIREDRIDILVDLAMHTANSRLTLFARKPAPVQATYLAYCSSTGLEAIDYRLSDPYLDPPGGDESIYSERTIRLPETYWCYQPIIFPEASSPLPVLAQGHITFGCLNKFGKVTDQALSAWAKILRAVPNSHLLLHAHEGTHRQRVHERIEREGVEPTRLRFAGFLPTEKYFGLYNQIDIALDTFPFGGGTTTCDALWMGVPVVSLVGKTAVGRGGLSILSNVGLPELAAFSQDDYVRIAVDLGNDLPRLSNLRSTLRRRMEQSPLMDAPKFTRNIEAAYREMWTTWCNSPNKD